MVSGLVGLANFKKEIVLNWLLRRLHPHPHAPRRRQDAGCRQDEYLFVQRLGSSGHRGLTEKPTGSLGAEEGKVIGREGKGREREGRRGKGGEGK